MILNVLNNKFMVNKFRTSKLCNCCNKELENFLERPKLKKEKNKNLSWIIMMQVS